MNLPKNLFSNIFGTWNPILANTDFEAFIWKNIELYPFPFGNLKLFKLREVNRSGNLPYIYK